MRGDNGGVHLINADLHSHSAVSDGALAPGALAARAAASGVELWALTDHDEVGGLAEARDAALDLGMDWLSGTEVSVTFAGETVHVLGLGFDPADEHLRSGLAATRSGRQERARRMGEDLARAGIHGAFEGAAALAGNPDLVSRTHFARHLVDKGVCASLHEVFRRYLKPGKPGYVPHRWAGLGDTVRWITRAGGMAVIAHPGRCAFTVNEEFALFSEFVAHGGRGVEVLTPAHTLADQTRFAGIALEFGLDASRGSDFHAPGESRVELGALPDLPGRLHPVWHRLQGRIHSRQRRREAQEWM